MIKESRSSRFGSLFNPVNIIAGLIIVVLLFSVYGTTSDKINTQLNQDLLEKSIQQNDKIEKVIGAEKKAGEIRAEQLRQLKLIVESQNNASKQRSESATTERMFTINQTLQVKQLVMDVGHNLTEAINHIENLTSRPQSNFTAQRQGVDNIEKILENQELILQKLNVSR